MSEVVAECTNHRCGAVFNTPNLFGITGGGSITIRDCGTNCPRCGSFARIFNGTFGGDAAGKPVFRSGPPETAAIVAALRKVLADAQAGEAPEDIIQELDTISPRLGEAAKRLVATRGLQILVALLLSFLASCEVRTNINVDVKLDATSVINRLIDTFWGASVQPHRDDSTTSKSTTDEPQSTGTVGTAPQPAPEEISRPSRQQRRLQERQSKKLMRRHERPCPPKQK